MPSEPQESRSTSPGARLQRLVSVLAILSGIALSVAIVLRVTRTTQLETARELAGQWSRVMKRTDGGALEGVWEFRPDGTLRVDLIDVTTGDKPSEWERPAVGHWKIDGNIVVFMEESWDFTYKRPVIRNDRLRIESLTATELVLQPVDKRGAPVQELQPMRFTRFAGWGKS